MLERIESLSPTGETLVLTLEDPSNGYSLRDAKGLGPVKATLVSSSYAKRNGSFFQSSRREERYIQLKVGLEEGYNEYSVAQLRMKLYEYFMPQTDLQLTLYTSVIPAPVLINGTVESCDPDIFSEDPQVDISITCFDPDFVDPTPRIVEGLSTATTDEMTIEYSGSLETGFVFTLLADRAVTGFSIYHRAANGVLEQMDFNESLVDGDTLRISTVPGSKGVFKNGSIPVLYGLSPQSPWLMLRPGNNGFRVYSEGDELVFNLEYTDKYGGL